MSSIFKKPLRLFVALFFVMSVISIGLQITQTPSSNIAYAQEEGGEGGGEEQIEDNSCEANGGEFSFFLCPALRLFEDGVTLFDQEVRKAIQINPDYYRESDAGTPLRDVWAVLQNIAYILLIPVMLILVIGTALGFSFLDAYTVRRAMPRLLFAVIFITLSYDIGVILIDTSNAFSRGIQGLLVSAVDAPSDLSLLDIFRPPVDVEFPGAGLVEAGGLTGGILVGGYIAFSVGALSIGIITSFLGSAALALLIVFLILMIRQLIVIMILVVLPLAIVTWIFPGNDKLWKLSWSTFIGLLIAGPAYAAMTILGRIAAYIINITTAGANDGLLSSALILITKLLLVVGALVGGLIAIQRLAGAAGALTGAVNDRSKGFFDRNKNFRANKRKERGELAANQSRFKETSRFAAGRGLAKLGNRIGADGRNLGKVGLTGKGTLRGRLSSARSATSEKQRDAVLDDDDVKAWKGNGALTDIAERWTTEGGGEKELRKRMLDSGQYKKGAQMERDVARVMAARAKHGTKGFQQAMALATYQDGTTYGRDNNEAEGAARVGIIAGDDMAILNNMTAMTRSAAMSSGRTAMGGAGHGDTAGMSKRINEEIEALPKSLSAANRERAIDEIINQESKELRSLAWQAQGPQTVGNPGIKPYDLDAHILTARDRLGDATVSLDQAMEEGDKATITAAKRHYEAVQEEISKAYAAMRTNNPQNAARWGDLVMDWDASSYDASAPASLPNGSASIAGSHIEPLRNRTSSSTGLPFSPAASAAHGSYGDDINPVTGKRAVTTRHRLEGYNYDTRTGNRIIEEETQSILADEQRVNAQIDAENKLRRAQGQAEKERVSYIGRKAGTKESDVHRTRSQEYAPQQIDQERQAQQAQQPPGSSGTPPPGPPPLN